MNVKFYLSVSLGYTAYNVCFFFFFFLRGAVYCRAEGIISRHTTRCRPLYGARSGVNAGLGGLSGHASQADGVIGRYAAVHL